jgi:hypothetical protein
MRAEFFGLKYDGFQVERLEDFFLRFDKLEDLGHMGTVIPEEDQVVQLLSAISKPPELSTLRHSIEISTFSGLYPPLERVQALLTSTEASWHADNPSLMPGTLNTPAAPQALAGGLVQDATKVKLLPLG